MAVPQQESNETLNGTPTKDIRKEKLQLNEFLLKTALDIFKDTFKHRTPVKFGDKQTEEIKLKESYSDVVEFTSGSYRDLIKWFTGFEAFVIRNGLSLEKAIMVIEFRVKPLIAQINTLIPNNKEIENTFDLQLCLVKGLYYENEAFFAMNRLMDFNSDSQNVTVTIREFQDLCYEAVVAMMAFKSPVIVDTDYLISVFINSLPLYIRYLCRGKFLDKKSVKLIEVLEYAEMLAKKMDKLFPKEDIRNMPSKKTHKEREENKKSKVIKCKCCGEKGHMKRDCNYKDEQCFKCKKYGHLGKVCNKITIKGMNDTTLALLEGTYKEWNDDMDNLNFRLHKLEKNSRKILNTLKKLMEQQSFRKMIGNRKIREIENLRTQIKSTGLINVVSKEDSNSEGSNEDNLTNTKKDSKRESKHVN